MTRYIWDKMILKNAIPMVLIVVLLLLSLMISVSDADYELTWRTIDGGGGRSSGGPYELLVTIGQPDAAAVSGGQYELLGGFLPGGPLCFVDFEHFARFAEHWLEEICDEGNNWCNGADLNQLDGVNGADLRFFVEQWLCYCPEGWPLN